MQAAFDGDPAATSIDEIIAEAGIAKGTYYYYFESKEATLEAVIDMMIEEEVSRAKEALNAMGASVFRFPYFF